MTGIQPVETAKSGLAIYPNPATSVFYFNVEGEVHNVKIFDMSGRLMKTELQPKNNSVNVASLPRGIYKVLVTGDKRNYTSSLIIK